MANEEAFTLDTLPLNDGVTFAVAEANLDPPQARYMWASSADTEGSALVVDPLHENRDVTLKIVVVQQASMDLALAKVAQLRDKLKKASATAGGIPLVWTPATSTLSATFDVLAGEITNLPIDWADGWLAKSPTLTVRLLCKPYWRGAEVTTSTASSSTPFVTLEIPDVPGDVRALGRVIVTDTASKSRRHVEWGLEGPSTYNASTSLLVDSDSLVTTGFAGSQTTSTGAYDPNASGNSAVSAPVQTTPSAMCGLGSLAHKGIFRVEARMKLPASTTSVRLAWWANDDYLSTNDWVRGLSQIDSSTWQEVDLGLVTLREPVLGSHSWTGQIETQDPVSGGLGGNAVLDYLTLVPAADGYGVARAEYRYRPGAVFAQDAFTSTTAAAALNARVAPLGGTWATTGDATDLAFADDLSGEQVKRSASSDTTVGRVGLLGTSTPSDSQVETSMAVGGSGETFATMSAVARWVDSSNYLAGEILLSTVVWTLRIRLTVAGSTVAEDALLFPKQTVGTPVRVALNAWSTGSAVAQVFSASGTVLATVSLAHTALATGGACATGKIGIRDRCTGGAAPAARYYDDFLASVPVDEPVALHIGQSLEFRHDDTVRENAAGTTWGRPKSYQGTRVTFPTGTSRVLVKARRRDIEAFADDQVTDATQIQVAYTPRGLVVPR